MGQEGLAMKPIRTHLWVKTDTETRKRFAAACNLMGITMQDQINNCMNEISERAFADLNVNGTAHINHK